MNSVLQLNIKVIISMQELNNSSSLQINEPSERIMIFSDDNIQNSQNNSLSELNYSKEIDASFSFKIQQQGKVPITFPQRNEETVVEPMKRKRKQIFQRFKKPNVNDINSQNSLNFTKEEDIMHTFDEVFKLQPDAQQDKKNQNKFGIFTKNKKKIFEPQNKSLHTPIKQKSSEPVAQELKQSTSKFYQTPLQYTPQTKKETVQTDSSNMQINRLSRIQNRYSAEQSVDIDLQEILESQIFNEKGQKIEERQRVNLEQTKNDLYQKIDMSQSMASSIMLKQSRFAQMDSPRNNIFGNFGKKSSPGGFFCQQEPQVFCNNVDVSNMVFQPTEEVRVPNFIKKLRMLNAVYPNFSHPHTNYDLENGKLQNIVLEANKSLLYVESMMKKIRKIERKRKQIIEVFTFDMSVQNFINLNWQKQLKFEGIQQLKPKINYKSRAWEEKKIEKALQNYKKIIQYYKGVKINLKDERGMKKYFEIRRKFWDVQRNIRMISEDMYTKINTIGLPYHYYEYLNSLKQTGNNFGCEEIKEKRKLLKKVKMLRKKNEQLSRSIIGEALVVKLQRQIKYLSPV